MNLNLPQCYLADLPPEAEITASLISEAWLALQRNRTQHLAPLGTDAVTRTLQAAAQLWLESHSPFMKAALEQGPAQLGFSPQTLEAGLRQVFGCLTTSHLEAWIEQDLGHPRRMDDFCASAAERGSRRRSKAVGPETLAQITAGNIPASAVISMVAGLLIRSAQFIKCATGTSLIPRLFAHALREVNAPLAACLEIAEWPRTRNDLLSALVESAELVAVTGTDESIAIIREKVPVSQRFIGHGHRVSFAFVAKDSMSASSLPKLLESVTEDVCRWNQLGCLSPHVIYVEEGGTVSAEDFAAQFATALARREESQPRGPLSKGDAATIRSRRSFYEIRAAHSTGTLLWQSPGSTAWTVVFEVDPQFQASCLHRFVYVKKVGHLEMVLQGADAVRGRVSTVGLCASAMHSVEIINRLAAWGVPRISPLGAMQTPPLLWRHDGRPALEELVRWTDLEEA